MALAYLDAREARIAMKLCEVGEAATRTTDNKILMDPQGDLDFLRVIVFSVLACAARRVKFFRRALHVLMEAKDICMSESDLRHMHPLLTAVTLLNLSAVLGDMDHDEHGLRWGLEALSLMYQFFPSSGLPEAAQAYYLALACHNAALLNVKQSRWADTVELVYEGIEFTRALGDQDDGLRQKLIVIGAQAKHVPERFLAEAVNALNGWGEEEGVWNLSLWDFTANEIVEEISVLQHTTTLKHLIIDHLEEEERHDEQIDAYLARLIIAAVACLSLEKISVSGIDFDPHKVWRRIKKRSFLETSWYASALNFENILQNTEKPDVACFKDLLKNLNTFSRKLCLFLVVLGNECDGVDLSENGIDSKSITALVRALRWPFRPASSRQASTVILRSNLLDAATCRELAKTWLPPDASEASRVEAQASAAVAAAAPRPFAGTATATATPSSMGDRVSPLHIEANVTAIDVSCNGIGDDGLEMLTAGIKLFHPFRALKAENICMGMPGCAAIQNLASTRIELLCLSKNEIGSAGADVISAAVAAFPHLHTLELNDCGIDGKACAGFSDLLKEHTALRNIYLNRNIIESEGAIEFCKGAELAPRLTVVHLGWNGIITENAAEAIGDMMRSCETLVEINISGNHIDPSGAPFIGSAIEHSRVLTMHLEDMGFTDMTIDDFLDHGAAETQDLQVMNLNGNAVGDDGLGIIAECLSIGLTDLSLSGCGLTAASQATLLNLVSLSPNLRSLNLSHNVLGPTGCVDMVTWMTQNEKENFSLRSLELAYCELGDEGFLQLVPVLSSLENLGLRGNGISSAGLQAVMNSHDHMIQLRCLDLEDNNIGEQGLHALTERFQKEHKRSLWNPKQLTSTIDQVILRNNDISRSLAASTEAFLKIHNPLLTVVW
eukprot:TRINITY_DN54821_c0_g1_i1.p1 TRINITY_DN54821_c0_g1~~TRINITY_DN54821_c0_g1_i1.p1  ORF type:complete len:1019 (-),score=208.66 TRINITY_DN54821_c0_g1_i1:211-2898(-)